LGFLKKNKAKVVISSWGEAPENLILSRLIVEFQEKNPHIQVELEGIPYGQYFDQILNQFAAHNAPDVLFVSSLSVAEFYNRGFLEPLTPFIRVDPSVSLESFYPSLVRWFTLKNNLYVLPRDIAPVCLVYCNQKLFKESGVSLPKDDWTVEDFLKVAGKLTQRDAQGNTLQWGLVEDYPVPEAWIYAFGGRFVDDHHHPKRYKMDSPEFLKGVQFRSDLANKHKVIPSPSELSRPGAESPTDMFLNGKAAMILSGIWKTPYFRDTANFPWDIVPIPRVPWSPRAVVGGSSGYGIASTSKYKAEAWDLIAFLSGAQGQAELASTGLVQPALESVANSQAFLDGKEPQNKKFLLRIVESALDDPLATNWLDVKRKVVYPALDKVWDGTETPEKALRDLNVELWNHPLELK